MSRLTLHKVDGLPRVLDLPDGWVPQEPSGNRSLGGGQMSFVIAGSVYLGLAVWGYRLPARTGWLSLATHCHMFLDDIARSESPDELVSMVLEAPCAGAVGTYNTDRLDVVVETNMRPSDHCPCTRLMRTECRR